MLIGINIEVTYNLMNCVKDEKHHCQHTTFLIVTTLSRHTHNRNSNFNTCYEVASSTWVGDATSKDGCEGDKW